MPYLNGIFSTIEISENSNSSKGELSLKSKNSIAVSTSSTDSVICTKVSLHKFQIGILGYLK